MADWSEQKIKEEFAKVTAKVRVKWERLEG